MDTGLTVLLAVLEICLLIGLPVVFFIGISCMALLTANGHPLLDIVVQRIVSGVKSLNMMAVSMFIFIGSLMVYGSMPHLMRFTNVMLRKMPGRPGAMTFAVCGFFGVASGSGVAGVAAIGKIIDPEMPEQRYPRGLTVGLITVGGTMACIILPSIVMVVYASPSGASVEDMFLAGFVPGSIRIIALIGLNTFLTVKRGNKESAEKTDYTAKGRLKITGDVLLPLLIPILVLGGVFSGTYTTTEALVMAVIYSFILAVFVYRELTSREFYKVATESVVTTGVIMLTISVAMPFGWIMSTQNIPTLFASWLLSITSNRFLIVVFVFLLLLLLGTFMKTMCIIILVMPILLPIAQMLGMGVVHYEVFTLMALTVGPPTPPLSVNLFITCRVLNVKHDEASPDALWIIPTVMACAPPTSVMPGVTELLPTVLK